METFLSIHRDVITGTLSTFDRIIFKGHLLDFFPARGLPNFLSRQGILLKGFGGYVQATSEELKTHIQRLAADAVRKQLTEIRAINPRDVLILSGDHLYRMDYAPFLRAHRQTERPIYTHPRFLPPSQVDRDCILDHVLLADGCRIVHSQICESVVGIRSLIGPDTRLTRTIMMGADEYETDAERAANAARGIPDIGVGRGCIIEGAIIDKNARIGDDVVIQHRPNREDVETESYVSRDGIIVVLKNAIIPKGTVI